MDINKVQLMGNVGKDPDIKALDGGGSMARFTMATSFKYKDNEYTEWHNIVCFDERLVDNVIAKYVKKGTRILISNCEIRTRKYEKDGQDHYITEIVIPKFKGELILIGKVKGGGTDDSSGGAPQADGGVMDDFDDDIPF